MFVGAALVDPLAVQRRPRPVRRLGPGRRVPRVQVRAAVERRATTGTTCSASRATGCSWTTSARSATGYRRSGTRKSASRCASATSRGSPRPGCSARFRAAAPRRRAERVRRAERRLVRERAVCVGHTARDGRLQRDRPPRGVDAEGRPRPHSRRRHDRADAGRTRCLASPRRSNSSTGRPGAYPPRRSRRRSRCSNRRRTRSTGSAAKSACAGSRRSSASGGPSPTWGAGAAR